MSWCIVSVLAVLVTSALGAPRSLPDGAPCEVRAELQSGWVCGIKRVADNLTEFASFLGVPYAAQPIGERRFSELGPSELWPGYYDASVEGPACPQHDVLYGTLLDTVTMSEACIYANVHVPIHALRHKNVATPSKELQPPHETGFTDDEVPLHAAGLPILVFIHGGGFAYGSGGAGVHGPEYMIHQDVIVITFNYRINVFGFLSLNSLKIPGNNGLRDVVTLLKWVRANARAFGGDPDNITLGGQSAGGAIAHLLSMSAATQGMIRRAILMSGTAIPSFYTTSPMYADFVANVFLSNLGLNMTDPDDIHRQLVKMPLEDIMEANKRTQDTLGVTAFFPVVETPSPGFTTILDTDPEILLSRGHGKDIPLVVGYTNAECETFRPNFEKLDILQRIKENPTLILPPGVIFKVPPKVALDMAKKLMKKYFNGEPTMDKYIKSCSDTFFIHPALKLTETRTLMRRAQVFLYEFNYEAEFSAIKETKGLIFKGAGHIEDMLFVLRPNSMDGAKGFSPPTYSDQRMIDWMTKFIRNFVYCNDPVCPQNSISQSPASEEEMLKYEETIKPVYFRFSNISVPRREMVQFFDSLQNNTS